MPSIMTSITLDSFTTLTVLLSLLGTLLITVGAILVNATGLAWQVIFWILYLSLVTGAALTHRMREWRWLVLVMGAYHAVVFTQSAEFVVWGRSAGSVLVGVGSIVVVIVLYTWILATALDPPHPVTTFLHVGWLEGPTDNRNDNEHQSKPVVTAPAPGPVPVASMPEPQVVV